MAQSPTLWNNGRPLNTVGMNRDNAAFKPVDPGLMARASGGLRGWLGMNNGGTELPFFPPGKPPDPVAPGAVGRQWDYPTNYNATIRARAYEPIDFTTLRAVAEPSIGGWDLIRMAIETRKDQMSKLTFSILPKKPVNAQMRPRSTPECQKAENFLKRPDGVHSWCDWVRMLIEEHLVIDAASIYKNPTVDGGLGKLDLIDGATIKPILGYDGRRPPAGEPAFSQVLKGLPTVQYTAEELIYAPRNPRVNKSYGYCYTPDHEVLTRRGWLSFTAVTLQDQVATRNPTTKAFEWQSPSRLVSMPHCGEVYRLHSKSIDLVVTPDHNVLLDSAPVAVTGGRRRTRGQAGEVLARAKDIALGHNPMNKIPMTSTWVGTEVAAKTFSMAEPIGQIEVVRRFADGRVDVFTSRRHHGSEKPTTISGDDYCALLGAYVAEGNIRSQGGLEITQFPKSKGYEPYAQLVSRILQGPAGHNGHAFVLARKGLTEHFKELGLQPDRFIPDEVMNASARQLQIFWDYFVLGDGSFTPSQNKSGRGDQPDQRVRITSTSSRLADQLMEITQKLGWSASKRMRKGGPTVILGRECVALDSYVISVRYSRAMGFKITPDWYEGDVHCVTVPNGVIYVRRNGKPAWCGNSPVEQVLTTINIGLRRQSSQLSFFTEGTVPDAVAAVPPDWSTVKIKEFQDYWDTIVNDAVTRRKLKFIPGGMALQHTRNDQALVDQFDEWLARIVQYCFSLPPTPLVRAVNRATAESAYDQSLDEGLQPLMIWLKNIIDDILLRWMGLTDVEMVWDDVKKVDPAEKEQRDLAAMGVGLISRDDMRADRGLEPLGIGPVVQGIGPLGFMSVAAMIKAINNGWDLTGMPQPAMPGDVPGATAGVPGSEAMDPALLGTGQPGDPLAGLPPEILEALGVSAPNASENGGDTSVGTPAEAQQAAQPPPSNVVPIHQHPDVQAALRTGEAHAKRLAARMAGAGR